MRLAIWKGAAVKKTKRQTNGFNIALNAFAWLSFFLAIILAAAVFLSTLSGTDNGHTVLGHKLLIVESDSMNKSPVSENETIFFASGDLIVIKEISDPSSIEIGDVITFVSYNSDSNGKTLSHKVRSVKRSESGELIGFETYGVNTGVSDEAIVDPSTVVGVYVTKIENAGILFKFFKTPAGYFTGILIPCLLLIVFFSVEVGKLLGRKEIADAYDSEIYQLKGRISQLENTEDGVIMDNNQFEKISSEEMKHEAVDSRHFELTVDAFNRTIETLAHTIESLALTVEKPVDTLARTVEVLSGARKNNDEADENEQTEEEMPVGVEEEMLPKKPIARRVVKKKEKPIAIAHRVKK